MAKTKTKKSPQTKILTKATNITSMEATGEKAFYMADGRVVTRLVELPEIIGATDDDTFNHHVNAERNDFANWIRDVFNIKPLATKVSKQRAKQDLIKALKTALK
jgi:hypothetical protein